MKMKRLLFVVACAALLGGCATTVPSELLNAREAYKRASMGAAAQVAPAELHVANQALDKAERSFAKDPDSYRTLDLAYVAQRKAELAEATASIAIERKNQSKAKDDYQAKQGQIVEKTKQDLNQSRTALAESERSGEKTAERLAAEQEGRKAADQRTQNALAEQAAADQRTKEAQAGQAAADQRTEEALAQMTDLKKNSRGTVITLSGSVLFASNQSTLLPAARGRLEQVSGVLLTTRERNLVVEGHTDSRGSESYNIELSQRRADSIRDYLVGRGYPGDRIVAHGLGEGRPIADNASAEGRANNRRVEIIIAREAHTSNP